MSVQAISCSTATGYVQAKIQQPVLAEALVKMGVVHEKWDIQDVSLDGVDKSNPTDGLVGQILRGDKANIDKIYNFRTTEGSISLISLSPQTPGIDELLIKFAAVHDHTAPEIRLILDGEGIFYIYTEEGQKYEILVDRGSFLVLPKEVAHNFTLTEKRTVTAVRVFQNKDGWIARPRELGKTVDETKNNE